MDPQNLQIRFIQQDLRHKLGTRRAAFKAFGHKRIVYPAKIAQAL